MKGMECMWDVKRKLHVVKVCCLFFFSSHASIMCTWIFPSVVKGKVINYFFYFADKFQPPWQTHHKEVYQAPNKKTLYRYLRYQLWFYNQKLKKTLPTQMESIQQFELILLSKMGPSSPSKCSNTEDIPFGDNFAIGTDSKIYFDLFFN